ncbi:MAG: YicC family protein [Lachnospiraceae bacterium]|nr:YicC family protein [Lachnospiraceae bacterium]
MVRSMTGFGRAESVNENRKLTVELKSVNNRYLDFNIRMPRKFNSFEAAIRAFLKEEIGRGKVDVFISEEVYRNGSGALSVNTELAAQYLAAARKLGEELGLENTVTIQDLMNYPDILLLTETEIQEDELWEELSAVLKEAVRSFNAAREAEGGRLLADLGAKLAGMKENVAFIREHEAEIYENYRTRLLEKVKELIGDREVDETQFASAIVAYADKVCTDEETVRLASHIEQMLTELSAGGSIGRKLDFLTQEMNREANTILSKAGDLATSNVGISLKTDVEKIREQIQNIE